MIILSTTPLHFVIRDEHDQITDTGMIYPDHVPDMLCELYTPGRSVAITLASTCIH